MAIHVMDRNQFFCAGNLNETHRVVTAVVNPREPRAVIALGDGVSIRLEINQEMTLLIGIYHGDKRVSAMTIEELGRAHGYDGQGS